MRPSPPPAFSVPEYRWFWASQLVSGIGTWAQSVAQAWLVLQLTGSALALGGITVLQFLPMLVLPLFTGVIADRLPRRKVLIATQTAALGQTVVFALLVWSGRIELWQIGALALFLGLSNAFGNPAQAALVPELVGRDLVANAVALNSVQFNVARLLGGAIGGTLVGVLGTATALGVNAVSFVPAVVVLLAIRPAHARRPSEREGADAGDGSRHFRADIAAGLRYALGNRPIRRVLALFGVVGLLGFNWSVATPLLAFALGAGPEGFGIMQASLGAGSLLAGLVLMRSRTATERHFLIGAVLMGVVLVLLGLSPWPTLSVGLFFLGGLGGVTASVTSNTRLQLLSVDAYRGRVMSLFTLLMGGTSPVGSLLMGAIAQGAGVQTALIAFGACLVLGLVLILAVDRTPASSTTVVRA